MEAWLFKRRLDAEMTRYCRQVIGRFDLRCVALLPLPLCRLLQQSPHPSRLWGMTRGGPEVSLLTRPGLPFPTALIHTPAISLPPPLFCQTCGLYQWDGWNVYRPIWKIKGLGDLLRLSRWHGGECLLLSHTHTHTPSLLFCVPNSLCLLSKDWLGKRPLSPGASQPSQKVSSS